MTDKKKLSKKEGRPIELPNKEKCPCITCKFYLNVPTPKEPTYTSFEGSEFYHLSGMYCLKTPEVPSFMIQAYRMEGGKSIAYDFPDVRECVFHKLKEDEEE